MALPHGTPRQAMKEIERQAGQQRSRSTAKLALALEAAPAELGWTMPIRPFWPPVSSRHSIVPCSTMKAKAIVIMAR